MTLVVKKMLANTLKGNMAMTGTVQDLTKKCGISRQSVFIIISMIFIVVE